MTVSTVSAILRQGVQSKLSKVIKMQICVSLVAPNSATLESGQPSRAVLFDQQKSKKTGSEGREGI